MSDEVTATESFEPTPAMKVWLDTTVETMNDNVSEISEACKDGVVEVFTPRNTHK